MYFLFSWLGSSCTTSPTQPGRESRSTWRTCTSSLIIGAKELEQRFHLITSSFEAITMIFQLWKALVKHALDIGCSRCNFSVSLFNINNIKIHNYWESFIDFILHLPNIMYNFLSKWMLDTWHKTQLIKPNLLNRCWTGTSQVSSTTRDRVPWTCQNRRAGSPSGWPKTRCRSLWVNDLTSPVYCSKQ